MIVMVVVLIVVMVMTTQTCFVVPVGNVPRVGPAGHIPQRRPEGPCVVVSVDFQSIASVPLKTHPLTQYLLSISLSLSLSLSLRN